MKKLLFLGVGSTLMMVMGGVGAAQADTIQPPHNILMLGNTGIATQVSTLGAGACAGCHRVHTAATSTLLKEPEALLCDSCHNGSGSSLNVLAGTQIGTGGVVQPLRAGGFTTAALNAAGATKSITNVTDPVTGVVSTVKLSTVPVLVNAAGSAAPIATTSSHLVDGIATGTMWGNGASGTMGQTAVTLQCGSCHDPHGNGNYRMLRPIPIGVSLPNTADATGALTVKAVGINIPDQGTIANPAAKAYTTANYWDVQAVGVALTATESAQNTVKAGTVTDGFLGNISAWCTTCHTRYLSSSANNVRTGDTTFTYQHRTDEQASNKPNCIQCHVAHGTDAVVTGNPAGTMNPDGSAQNSDLLRVDNRGTCLMCHNM